MGGRARHHALVHVTLVVLVAKRIASLSSIHIVHQLHFLLVLLGLAASDVHRSIDLGWEKIGCFFHVPICIWVLDCDLNCLVWRNIVTSVVVARLRFFTAEIHHLLLAVLSFVLLVCTLVGFLGLVNSIKFDFLEATGTSHLRIDVADWVPLKNVNEGADLSLQLQIEVSCLCNQALFLFLLNLCKLLDWR